MSYITVWLEYIISKTKYVHLFFIFCWNVHLFQKIWNLYFQILQHLKFEKFWIQTCFKPLKARMSILYRRSYRFGHWYDIFRISVNIGVPFRVYRYFFIFINIYMYIYVCMCLCVYIYKYIYYNKYKSLP